MKFKTFRALALSGLGVVGLAVCGGVGWGIVQSNKPKPTPTPFVDEERNLFDTLATPAPVQTDLAISVATGGLRSMDREIIEKANATNITAADGKIKDAIRGRPWKVNFYAEGDRPGPVSRLKIDLDRDDKWDEKWSREGAGWKRQVSSRENEEYDQEFTLHNQQWIGAGAPQAVVTAAPVATATQMHATSLGDENALRPMDARILEKARQPIRGDKIKDAFPSEKWKVNLYQDAGNTRPNRLKIDFDRDEKWDEKWTFEGEEVKRQVAPKDDDVYTVEYRLRAGAWVKK